jgi:hypothetical protein
MNMKRGLLISLALIATLGLSVWAIVPAIPRLFRRNAELKAQGYYMAEFEFKMLAAQHQLNQGNYLDALRTLRRIQQEMQDPPRLVKTPAEATLAERATFLIARQNPETGAFMDPHYPLFTYFAPTANAVENLAQLSAQTGQPLRLKHPLRFLDQLQQPEQLRAYLDPLLYLREWCARMPGPGPYGPGVSELAYFDDLERAGVYEFSEEWENTLRQWFYDTQDPNTGFWGSRIGTPARWRQKPDITSTYHILHLVLEEKGGNRNPAYPLRHADNLARSILARMGAPLPRDAAEQHDWGLSQTQGAKALTRLLWPHLNEAEKEDIRRAYRLLLAESYRLYRPETGGFAYYTTDARADLDGTGLALGLLHATGALPGTWERERLWGQSITHPPVSRSVQVHRWTEVVLPSEDRVQSIRIYVDQLPIGDSYDDSHLVHIAYPGPSPACDIMDLRQRVMGLLASNELSFGNWTSKESLLHYPLQLERPLHPVTTSRQRLDWAEIDRNHPHARRFYAIGYDAVQVPLVITEIRKTANTP